jgi:signal transduction histidine kinase
MRERLAGWSTPRVDPRLFDAVLTLVFVVLSQLDVWAPWGDNGAKSHFGGPLWLNSALLLIAVAPMLWRRRAPLLTAGALAAGITVDVVFVSSTAPFIGAFVPVLIAAYSLAAYEGSLPRSAAGLAALAGAVTAVAIAIPELGSVGDLAFNLFCLACAWALGRIARRMRRDAKALSRRAEDLERSREQEAREAVELERGRIARELHDVIAHSVSLMGIQAAAAEGVLTLEPERAREPLRAIQATAREAVDELRRLLGVLRETHPDGGLSPQPGLAALDTLAEQMRAAGLPVELRVEGAGGAGLSPGIELSAYRIVQEALTNALKHAGGASATVVIRHLPDELEIEVTDRGGDGGGGNGKVGHGLIGMRERVALYGGAISTGAGADGGYAVHASLPHARRS